MKKFLGLVLVALSALFLVNSAVAIEKPEVTDHEKINVYIFRGSGCSHCYDALNFLYGLDGEYNDYFKVVTYEVWNDSNNAALAKDVANKLGAEFGGVPFIVIGDKSFGGFGEDTGVNIINTALDFYKSKDYKDVVASVLKSKDYKATSETLEAAAYSEGITEVVPPEIKEEKKNDTWVIVAVFAVIIGGFGALIFSSRKK